MSFSPKGKKVTLFKITYLIKCHMRFILEKATLFLEEVRHDVMGIGNGIFRNRKDAESGNSTRSRLLNVAQSGFMKGNSSNVRQVKI